MIRWVRNWLAALAFLVAVSLGGNAYSIFLWPDKVKQDAIRNANEAARLTQREKELRLDIERLSVQRDLTKSNLEVAKATIQLTEFLRAEHARYSQNGKVVRP